MRLAAQMKGGFYPAPPEAVALAATLLCPPAKQPFSLLDPCAGEGAALHQLAELLGCPPAQTYAIELDDSRAARLHVALPAATIRAPASFFGCRASLNSFSLVWLNPPFDHGYGGPRMEDQFLRTATDWLMPGGVMALVCPEDVVDEYTDARRHFASHYENCQIVPFPRGCRHFHEVLVLGAKRAHRRADERSLPSWDAGQAPRGFRYSIPAGRGPRTFQKVEPTEAEWQRMLAGSPLRSHLTAPAEPPLPTPPLALHIGHIALLLASGHLDGRVEPPGQPPHVVRGTSRKRAIIADVTETEEANGSSTRKTTLTERIELIVRTVDSTGQLQTFMDTEARE